MDLLLGYTQKASYQWRYLSILIYPWSSPLLANVGLWSYTQQSSPRTKDHRASPQTDHSSVHSLYQPGVFILYFTVLGSGHVHEASGEHYLTWEFLLFLGQLLFTVLGSGHVHEASGAHRLSNRADPWITSWLGGPPPFVRHSEDSSIMANYGAWLWYHWR